MGRVQVTNIVINSQNLNITSIHNRVFYGFVLSFSIHLTQIIQLLLVSIVYMFYNWMSNKAIRIRILSIKL